MGHQRRRGFEAVRVNGVQGNQEAHDRVHATSIALRAARIDKHPTELPDTLCLAALYNLAAEEEDIARGQMANIAARFPEYKPGKLFDCPGERSPYLIYQIRMFKKEHSNSDDYFDRARRMLEEEKSRCGRARPMAISKSP